MVPVVSFRVVLCNPRRLCQWNYGAQCNPRRLCWLIEACYGVFWFIGGASGFVQVWVRVGGGVVGFVQVWVRVGGGASGFVQVWVRAVGGVVGFVSCGVVQPETPLLVGLCGAV